MSGLKWTAAAVAALALAAAIGVRFAGDRAGGTAKAAPGYAMMAMPVPVARVVKKTLPIYLSYPGRVEAIRAIQLQARTPGYIVAQPAKDGADVKEGDLLYKIDPRDMQAALDQARAQLQRDQAALEYAKANFSRGEELLKSGYVARDTFDQRSSAMRSAEAALSLDQAAVEAATLNLGYAEIRAPFAGRLGHNLASTGALVGPATGALNTLVELDPVYVSFNPSDVDLAEIEKARAAGAGLAAEIATSGDAAGVTRKGELTFLDNVIDRGTATIMARVTIDNPDFALRPGQYVRVKLRLRDQPDTLMAPVAALGSNQMGKYVYVVGEGDKAELRPLELGPGDGDLVSVAKGLKDGDRIIVGNLQKIGPGSPVQPLPAKAN